MTSFRADPLLGTVRALLMFLMAVLIAAAVALVIAMPTVLFVQGEILAKLAKELPKAATPGFIWGLEGILLLALGLTAAAWAFIRKLRQIVDTVGTGDPFIPTNARRLHEMAWLAIGFQVLGIPLGGLAVWLAGMVDAKDVKVDISGNGVMLALVLFVLARVFRTGAAMRAELEGTV